jgi:aryl-alcohol dehydrogenase-like predicted oxidoreductase
METRPFGHTGIRVPVLDLGLTLIDTARSYGLSEERIGRHLARCFAPTNRATSGLVPIPATTKRGLGTLAKRSLAALRTAGLDVAAPGLDGFALRFSAYAPGVDCVIVGGADARHLQNNVAAVSAGPLRPQQLAAIRGAFSRAATNWRGLV